jgi:hypothetical protein
VVLSGIRLSDWQTTDPVRLKWQLSELEKRVAELSRLLAIAQARLEALVASAGDAQAAGSDTQVQFNSGGAFAGAVQATIDGGDLALLDNAAPTTPSAGAKLVSFPAAGRSVPTLVDVRGEQTRLQLAIHARSLCLMRPNAAGTTPSLIGLSASTSGTATARQRANTNALRRLSRMAYATGAVAGTIAEWRATAAQVTTGSGTIGGFWLSAVFAASDAAAVAGVRGFCGLASAVAATNVEPSTVTNCVGLAQLSTDTTQMYLVYGGAVAQTPIPLGTSFAPYNAAVSSTTGNPFALELWSPRAQVEVVHYHVTNLHNGAVASGTLSVVPPNTQMLSPKIWRCNNATALDAAFDIAEFMLLDEPP